MDFWYAHRPKAGLLFAFLGLLALACSFLLAGPPAWLVRMAALTLAAAGAQWLPRSERWLQAHQRERLAIATALGLALVWMLAQYGQL
ncbi:MAG TPA: hypothetical protein VGE07_01110 [Herpetosiphonaceae bacterium]